MASPCFSFPEMTWIIPLRLCSMIPWNSLPVTPCAENLWQLSSTQVLRSNSPFAVKWISSHISLKYPKVAKKKRWSFKGNFSSLNKCLVDHLLQCIDVVGDLSTLLLLQWSVSCIQDFSYLWFFELTAVSGKLSFTYITWYFIQDARSQRKIHLKKEWQK